VMQSSWTVVLIPWQRGDNGPKRARLWSMACAITFDPDNNNNNNNNTTTISNAP